jgi:hypothetical protein
VRSRRWAVGRDAQKSSGVLCSPMGCGGRNVLATGGGGKMKQEIKGLLSGFGLFMAVNPSGTAHQGSLAQRAT